MENRSPKLNAQSKRNLPPKRGQIKLRIIKRLIGSVASIGGSSKRDDRVESLGRSCLQHRRRLRRGIPRMRTPFAPDSSV